MIEPAPPIDEQPRATMMDWVAVRMEDGIHLCGIVEETGRARLSTAVRSYDRVVRTAVTASGRVYRLGPSPGSRIALTCLALFVPFGGVGIVDL